MKTLTFESGNGGEVIHTRERRRGTIREIREEEQRKGGGVEELPNTFL